MKNNEDGTFTWARPLHADNIPYINTVKVDKSNNIVVIGNYEAYLIIDNNTFQANTPSSNRSFIAKFNNSGGFQWQRNLTYYSSVGIASNSKIDIDSNNNIYTATTYYEPQSVSFPNKTFQAPIGGRNIIYKIDPSGNLVWRSIIKSEDAYDFLSIKLNTDNTINFL